MQRATEACRKWTHCEYHDDMVNVRLDDAMRGAVERQGSGRVVSRAPDGGREEAQHSWLAVWDAATLAFADVGAAQTVRNLVESPDVEVVVTDPETGAGFRFAGAARVLLSGPTFDRMRAFFTARGLASAFEHVVFVDVQDVVTVASGGADGGLGAV